MKESIVETLRGKYEFVQERESLDWPAVTVPQEHMLAFMTALRDEYRFDLLNDVTAIDWGQEAEVRFTVIYHLYTTAKHFYLRVSVDCMDNAMPAVPSVQDLWPAANWHEREAYDMFGIEFKGHPDLTRILMWEGYPYHPLRKEFPLAGIEVDLPAADVAETTKAKVIAAPMMGGPFRSGQGLSMKYREPSARDESWTERTEKPTEID